MSFLRLPTIGLQKRKRKQYDPKSLYMAYSEVRETGCTIARAAQIYGVPDSTLRDRFLGLQPLPTVHSAATKPGPVPTFTTEEEQKLMTHVAYMAEIGYGYSRKEFLTLATEFAISLKKKTETEPPFAQSWFNSFKKRNPEMTLAKPQKLSIVRAKCTSNEILNNYFSNLQEVLENNGLAGRPENIWNIDETGISLEHRPTNILCVKGSTPPAVTSNRGKTVTIIAGGNAAGSRLPPYYIFPGKRWNEDLMTGASPGSAGTVTESGWSNSHVFIDYIENHFLCHAPANGHPLLVLFDGHKSHVNLTLADWGKTHNIVFYVLPPHTSHITQPLDVGCFGPLKNSYYAECQSFMRKNPGLQISRLNVAQISSKAYNKALIPENLISAFRKSGIYPFDRNQIKPNKTAPSVIYNTKTNDEKNVCDSEKEDFLDKRKITKVTENIKKRKSQPSVCGNITSPSKQPLLKKICTEVCTTKPNSRKSSVQKPSKSPKPSTSAVRIQDSEDSENSIDTSEDMCCVCEKFSPESLNNDFTLEIVQWAQCDNCEHWTHLKYCTSVRCLRRGAQFLCPHCD